MKFSEIRLILEAKFGNFKFFKLLCTTVRNVIKAS